MNWLVIGAVLTFGAVSAFAADPFAGTWKQNKPMSGGALAVQSDTPVIRKIDLTDANTARITDSENGAEQTFPLDGIFVRISSGRNAGEDDSLNRLHARVWAFRRKTHGRTYPDRKDPTGYDEEGYYTISVDEKTMIWAVLRTYTDGRVIYYNRVFERQ